MENTNNNIKCFIPNISKGLTKEQVEQRIKEGLVNFNSSVDTNTIPQIIKNNLFTLFNLINIILALAILYVGSYKNLMFMGVVICNSLIGIVQEIRAKKAVDSLNLISSVEVNAIRDSQNIKLKVNEIVQDDIICYSSGNQIVSDCIILEGNCEANESLLTGESDSIPKKKGDKLLSGSFISSGICITRVENVGAKNYASTILHDTKYIKNTESEIMITVKKIIKIISIYIIPIGILLFWRQLNINNFNLNNAIVNTSAALIGMIPEGLVLLISTVLAVGVVRLAKHKVLVQDIYCIETLARVDTLCLDKTGTITTGNLQVEDVIPHSNSSKEQIFEYLSMLSSNLKDSNETFTAIKKYFNKSTNTKADIIVPFSSDKKWSGAYFRNYGSFVIGAAEFILENQKLDNIKDLLDKYSSKYRVLTLAKSNIEVQENKLPDNLEILAFVLIKDQIRPNASETIKYFLQQNVDIKIISGDNPLTVSSIAKSVGVKNADKYIDATNINDNNLLDIVKEYTVFGRVTPNQKLKIIQELKKLGHTVAMTGDGVNDVLALKEADCSIAVANGSDAARNVSHLILLDSDFSSMPKVVAEGRRSINNIQRSSSLFLVKTIYSAMLSLIFLLISVPYPFVPIQMTLISSLTIGIPSFILALEPNKDRVTTNLFKNIISKSLPTAIITVLCILICIFSHNKFNLSQGEYSTICVIITGYIELMLLYNISIPFNFVRKILFYFVSIFFAVGVIFFKELFSLHQLSIIGFITIILLFCISTLLFKYINKLINKHKVTSSY